jgi:hypothetical protein
VQVTTTFKTVGRYVVRASAATQHRYQAGGHSCGYRCCASASTLIEITP